MTEVVERNSPGVNVAFPSWVLFSASSLDHLPQKVKMEERHSPVGWWQYNRHTRCQGAASPVIPTDPHLWFSNSREKFLSKLAFSVWAEAKSRRMVCFALVKKNSQSQLFSLSTIHVDGRRGEHHQPFCCQCQSKKVVDTDTQHPTNGPWAMGHDRGGGQRAAWWQLWTTGQKKISSPLLLISSNDVPVGWHALCHPYCHYNAPFSLLLRSCVTEWMFHGSKFATTTNPPTPPGTAAHSHFYFSYEYDFTFDRNAFNVEILSIV